MRADQAHTDADGAADLGADVDFRPSNTPQVRYWLTRFVFLRALGLVHVVAFAIVVHQVRPLIGSHGLLPATHFLEGLRDSTPFWSWPTLFYWNASDAMLVGLGWLGLLLSILVLLGAENALLLGALWALYMSYCHVGQVFWGYGWEILLLETTFLAMFLCPLTSVRPLSPRSPPPTPVIWMLRWLAFRLMLGAGLIKLRGDPCWSDLTCLAYHYETQPIPHPGSWLLHQAPLWFHKLGVLANHLVELVAPFFVFGPRRLRLIAGVLLVAFQTMLILSGNLSFLNWLTLVVCLACFDDGALAHVLPRRLVAVAEAREGHWATRRSVAITVGLLGLLVGLLSIDPVKNLLSPRQAMNTSFDPLHLVNTYGAFGSVGKERDEVVLQGTRAQDPNDPEAVWVDYEFPCKPGAVDRRPCLVTPYHYRLDWQMWFAALSDYRRQPWLIHLIYKLLAGDPMGVALLANDPFEGRPPRYIRAERYRYRFTRPDEGTEAWWHRERIDSYLPPLAAHDPALLQFLRHNNLPAPP